MNGVLIFAIVINISELKHIRYFKEYSIVTDKAISIDNDFVSNSGVKITLLNSFMSALLLCYVFHSFKLKRLNSDFRPSVIQFIIHTSMCIHVL